MATRRARPTPGLVVVAAHHHPPLDDHRSEESTPRSLLTTAPLPVAIFASVDEGTALRGGVMYAQSGRQVSPLS